jgi:hemerythrin-like metal-binding protein
MPYVRWDSSWSVGVPELDEQHRAFVQVLDELHDVLMAGDFHEVLEARDRALDGIERYVWTHFSTEEQYMAGIGYPGLDQHRQLHEQFTAQVKGYRAAIASGEQVLNSKLVKAMIEWVRDHLVGEDRKYAAFRRGAEPSSVPPPTA